MMGSGAGTWGRLRAATRRVRRQAMASVALVALSLAPLVLLVAWVAAGRLETWATGPLALLLAGTTLAVVVVALLVRRWVAPVTDAAIAAAAERRHGMAEGSIRGVLELSRGVPAGASAALYRRTERALAARLEHSSPAELAGDVGERSRSRGAAVAATTAGLMVLASLAGFAAPDRAREAWTPLLHPVVHLRGAALEPLSVAPGDAAVARGTSLAVEVGAPLRSRVTLDWRSEGNVPGSLELIVAAGVATTSLGPVDAPIEYRVRAPDGATSRWFRVLPIDPLLLAGLEIDVVYPGHVGREAERVQGELAPSLAVPEGTVLRLRGMATRELTSAVFHREDGRERRAGSTGTTFSLDWRPDVSDTGFWELRLAGDAGEAGRAATLRLSVSQDAAPRVRILVPGADTVLSATRRLGVVAEATDDHGLSAAALVYRRAGARGPTGPVVRLALPVESGLERTLIRTVLDLSGEPLVPGDAVDYHVEVRDNSPSGQVGRSATYRLRVPSAADLRQQARAEAAELMDAATGAAQRARELDRSGRELSRRLAAERRSAGTGAGSGSEEAAGLDSRRAAEARQLADAHDEARRELEDLRQRLDQLRAVAAESGVGDRELDRRLERLADLYRSLASADRAEADALRQAAEGRDASAVAAELARLLAQQDALRQRLEESLAMLRDAALDQELAALAREAQEIAAEQEVLAAAMRTELGGGGSPPPEPSGDGSDPAAGGERAAGGAPDPGGDRDPDAAGGDGAGETEDDPDGGMSQGMQGPDLGESRSQQQKDLAGRTMRLTELIESLQQMLLQSGDEQSASQAGSAQEQGRSAQQSMETAAEQASQQQGEEAAASGEQAAGALSSAARSLDEVRGQRTESARHDARAAVEGATQDALRLAEREEALRQQMEAMQAGSAQSGGDGGGELQRLQSEQAAVQQGLEQLGRNLSETVAAEGMLDRDVARALARAMLDMEQTQAGLRSGGGLPVQEAGRAVASLNRLAMALLQTDDRSRRASDPGLAEMVRRLTELAQEQGALNAQAGSLSPLAIDGRAETEQLTALAEGQRGVARRVGEVSGLVGGREDVLGQLNELAGEAAAIAMELDGGRLVPEVRARQERLFHRLLDAGRTLERDDVTEERAGETAERRVVVAPEAIDETLLSAVLRYPGPSARELRELPAAYRRLVLEYFDRLNADAGAERPAEWGVR
jgi:hypothetical protein